MPYILLYSSLPLIQGGVVHCGFAEFYGDDFGAGINYLPCIQIAGIDALQSIAALAAAYLIIHQRADGIELSIQLRHFAGVALAAEG